MTDSKFVFVVCGGKEHIDTLHFSLEYLKYYSDKEIVILTDSTRNEIPIVHDNVIDVKAPEEYDHHQASIYLKTGVHKFVPAGKAPNCYLDTDVVAVDNECDSVFGNYNSPIAFCSDHCKMPEFSPSAVMDAEPSSRNLFIHKELGKYFKDIEKKKKEINTLNKDFVENRKKWMDNIYKGQLLKVKEYENEFLDISWRFDEKVRLADESRANHKTYLRIKRISDKLFNRIEKIRTFINRSPKIRAPFRLVRFGLKVIRKILLLSADFLLKVNNIEIKPYPHLETYFGEHGFTYSPEGEEWLKNGVSLFQMDRLMLQYLEDNGYSFNEESCLWETKDGKKFADEDFILNLTKKDTGIVWNPNRNAWQDQDGNIFRPSRSDALRGRIKEAFDVNVSHPEWQHWNGGVFLYNEDSTPFLDTWHNWTLEAFDLPAWFTRDQGTLIASVWKHGLENHPVLPLKFNLLADYYHPTMVHKGNLQFDVNEKRKGIKPSLIHIYHHWADKSWDVWQEVTHRYPKMTK